MLNDKIKRIIKKRKWKCKKQQVQKKDHLLQCSDKHSNKVELTSPTFLDVL
jgi:hypothetical protein